MRRGQDLQVRDQDATTEAVVGDPKVVVVEEHHPGVGGGAAIDDGGGGGDDATPRVREAFWLTFTLWPENKGGDAETQK